MEVDIKWDTTVYGVWNEFLKNKSHLRRLQRCPVFEYIIGEGQHKNRTLLNEMKIKWGRGRKVPEADINLGGNRETTNFGN